MPIIMMNHMVNTSAASPGLQASGLPVDPAMPDMSIPGMACIPSIRGMSFMPSTGMPPSDMEDARERR